MSTCRPKEPPLIEAAGEDDRSLGERHEEVADCEVDNEHVGRCPEASAPVRGQKLSGGASTGEPPSITHAHMHIHTWTCAHRPMHMHTYVCTQTRAAGPSAAQQVLAKQLWCLAVQSEN